MEKLFIPVLLGTARKNNQSEKVANFVFSQLQNQEDVETKLVDVKDFIHGFTASAEGDGYAKVWQEAMGRANGLVIVTPEYNHGYPGELKILLDSLYSEYEKKPVSVCGVSSGAFGGTRVVEHLKQVLLSIKMVPTKNAGYFCNVKELFDDEGKIKDDSYEGRMKEVFEELLWYARALKAEREK